MPKSNPRRVAKSIDLDAPASLEKYFDELAAWLDLEAEAERERLARRRLLRSRADVERSGETLLGMRMIDHTTGLAGRLLLDFAKPGDESLPPNRLKVGAPAVISNDQDDQDRGVPGVVSRRRHNLVQVATDQWPDGVRFRLDLSPDETTRKRQLAAMGRIRQATGPIAKLRDRMLGARPLRFDAPEPVDWITDLNPSQQDAVRFALTVRDVGILHGPPGTGKTTTLAEVILQAVRRGERVLACAPSNTAVDNLLERLVQWIPRVLRVGHPARVFEALRGHTLDELVDQHPSADVIRDMRREVESLVRDAGRSSRGYNAHRRRRELYAEAGKLRGQIRMMERSVIRGLLEDADVICTTTTIDDDLLSQQTFDLAVIDEACQCPLPGVWQAVLRADRLVLAGDHQQLPPTVLSDEAAQRGMRDSLMQRLIRREGDAVFRRLAVQYRMHEAIMQFSSQQFYDGELVADAAVQSHRLVDLPGVRATEATEAPLAFFDTAGAEFTETIEPNGESKRNVGEANVILHQVRELLDAGVAADQLAVIAPYAAQVRLLRDRCDVPKLEIDTVDGFQGREKEVVLLTLVRSNDAGEIGFLADSRRTNVALTRARRKLIVVGDSATLGRHPFYADLLDYFDLHGAYRSVWELEL